MLKGNFGGERERERDVRVIKSGKWKEGRPLLELKSTGEREEQRDGRMCHKWSHDPEAFSRYAVVVTNSLFSSKISLLSLLLL